MSKLQMRVRFVVAGFVLALPPVLLFLFLGLVVLTNPHLWALALLPIAAVVVVVINKLFEVLWRWYYEAKVALRSDDEVC